MLEGELRVTEYYGDQEIFLAEVIPGAFFSEIEILLDVPHSVLTRAVADSRLFRLPRARFWDLLRLLAFGGKGNHADAGDAIAEL